MNIYELIRGRRHYVAEERARLFMYQLLKAMDHMHRRVGLGGIAPRWGAEAGAHAQRTQKNTKKQIKNTHAHTDTQITQNTQEQPHARPAGTASSTAT